MEAFFIAKLSIKPFDHHVCKLGIVIQHSYRHFLHLLMYIFRVVCLVVLYYHTEASYARNPTAVKLPIM